jgi:uncharacterized membrane protein
MPLQHNVVCTLCYLLGAISGALFLFLEPYNQNREVRFHAWQSILLNIVFFAAALILRIAWGLPLIGIVFVALAVLLQLAGVVLWLYLLYTAFNGQKIKLPIIGDMAERQA